ncbi:hypothetical protein CYLTODRAFT_419066 [Cylindrobasidium torrendii FP15055 ss-10]|uniref:DUF6534 domain-containing protein n=1 Tax=Cylindrobasidium torrendii FP15055 ss-10 TaxID=1314674 RepID=A0A0D7BM00_9AGAR|nr:hypothetical protein CYLTODRAFT_419066 [Cylindrobasidium torrendii FP15055 ss-10]
MPALPTLDNTIGLLFDTAVIGAALYGAGVLQAWLYFRKFSKRDSIWVKGCVGAVLVFDTIQVVMITVSVYKYVITNHGNSAHLAVLEKTLIAELYFSGPIALLTQVFYAYRIYALSKSFILAGLVVLLGLASFIILYTYSTMCMGFSMLAELIGPLATQLTMANTAITALCDISITVIMIVCLQRSKTGFRRSTDILNRLIIFVFNTGIPTTLCAIIAFAMVKGEPYTNLFMLFYLLMGRFYTNSLLVTLNSREYIHSGGTSGDNSTRSGEISLHTVSGNLNPQNMHHPTVSIRIETEHAMDHDSMTKYGGKNMV